MAPIFRTAVALALTVSIFACSQSDKKDKAGSTEPMRSENAAPDIDVASLTTTNEPVCGMTVGNKTVADTMRYQGKLYGFCSTECKAEFAQSPSKYIHQ